MAVAQKKGRMGRQEDQKAVPKQVHFQKERGPTAFNWKAEKWFNSLANISVCTGNWIPVSFLRRQKNSWAAAALDLSRMRLCLWAVRIVQAARCSLAFAFAQEQIGLALAFMLALLVALSAKCRVLLQSIRRH
jgi:hypothetical protein